MKIVINACYGGFGLSDGAISRYAELVNVPKESVSVYDIPRDNPQLVMVVESLGERADDIFASLRVVEIPDNVEWEIRDYDGYEWIAEKHRTWR